MDNSKQPGISFDSIILNKLVFSRKTELTSRPELDVKFKFGAIISDDKNNLQCELAAIIKEIEREGETPAFEIECSVVGLYSIIKGEVNMELDEFAKVNAPAMMLPYLREIIANTTLRAGLKPIILPPLNVYSLIESSE